MKTNSTTIDNRDLEQQNAYLEARVEALTAEVRKLTEYIREQKELADEYVRRIVE